MHPAGLSSPGTTGRLLDARHPSKHGYKGLRLGLQAGRAADLTIEIGNGLSGSLTRRMTLTAHGAWLAIGGGEYVKIMVNSVQDATTQLSWEWTADPPPFALDLTWVTSWAAGGTRGPIPAGAKQVALNVADGGFSWITNVGAGDLTMAVAIAADTLSPVLGAEFTPSIANTAWWILDPL